MRVLVCGGSSYQDQAAVFRELDRLHNDQPLSLVINGGARGADYLASQWAKQREVPLRVFRADWQQFGEQAVFALNEQMIAQTRPEVILAFPGGDVTADMCRRAELSSIRVVRVAPQ
ncbi:MAG: DUF2493 domain-containing protein [Gammaproteobacteria bacterium]